MGFLDDRKTVILHTAFRMSGIIKVAAIPSAIEFYRGIGFEENPDGSREMILPREKTLKFLEAHTLLWRK